jgi:AcrR family transcriptional regulator
VFKSKGARTRERVLAVALRLFRQRGFARTTMRDVAAAADLALGAAYHYFPSKEALLLAYFEGLQDAHEERAAEAIPAGADLKTRLSATFHTKLDLVARDRRLLGALFGELGDPSHPLSLFGRGTRKVRERSLAQFEALAAGLPLAAEGRRALGRTLWLAHVGLLLYFVHDRSAGQRRTRRLTDAVVELAVSAPPPLLGRLLALVTELEEGGTT